MAGNPADLTIFIDTNVNNNHSYHGNGCSAEEGSKTPCSTNIVKDGNNENQKNGTYYTFQAATSGSGGTSLSTLNANAPDTFCPLGWQMPYSGTGGDYYDKTKSWKYLFGKYGYGDNSAGTVGIRSYPLSYINGGKFSWNYGKLYDQSSTGSYWTITTKDGYDSFTFSMWPTGNDPSYSSYKINGDTIRCNSKVSILILKHNWFILKT